MNWVVFFGLAAYHTDNKLYYPNDDPGATPTVGYSWIWHHFEHWVTSLVLNLVGVAVFISGTIREIRQSGWKLSDFIKIEVIETEEVPFVQLIICCFV